MDFFSANSIEMGKRKAGSSLLGREPGVYHLPSINTPGVAIVTTDTPGVFAEGEAQVTTESINSVSSMVPNMPQTDQEFQILVTTDTPNTFNTIPPPFIPFTEAGTGVQTLFIPYTNIIGQGLTTTNTPGSYANYDLPVLPGVGVQMATGLNTFVYTLFGTDYTATITPAGSDPALLTPAEVVAGLNSILAAETVPVSSPWTNMNELFTFNYDSSTQMLGITHHVTSSTVAGGVKSFPTIFGWTNTTMWTGFTTNAQYWAGSKLGVVPGMNLVTTSTTGTYAAEEPPNTQVNADWTATTDPARILHKPTIPAAQVRADWDTSGTCRGLFGARWNSEFGFLGFGTLGQ